MSRRCSRSTARVCENFSRTPEAFDTSKLRPSGHDIAASFGMDNGGTIPSNLLQIPNSESNGAYLAGCSALGLKGHPARFPAKLPQFFIRFLASPGDVVLDIFAGSNTTGKAAEQDGRRWLAFEERLEYLAASSFRFLDASMDPAAMRLVHDRILEGTTVSLTDFRRQLMLAM